MQYPGEVWSVFIFIFYVLKKDRNLSLIKLNSWTGFIYLFIFFTDIIPFIKKKSRTTDFYKDFIVSIQFNKTISKTIISSRLTIFLQAKIKLSSFQIIPNKTK